MVKIGIIGGSGLDDPGLISALQGVNVQKPYSIKVQTPFGEPSSSLTLGRIGDIETVVIARHGRRHQFSPSQVNYRANIQAFKDQGVTHILATTACGSLRQEIGRGDFVILDQFIDFTRHRPVTMFDSFEDGAHHTAMAEPFDAGLREHLIAAARAMDLPMHPRGTVVTIEGPRFSTRAESHMFRAWGADVINMSVATEAICANEAAIPYAAVAMSTDYDCWKEDEAPVTWDEILEVFHQNVDKVKQLLNNVVPLIANA